MYRIILAGFPIIIAFSGTSFVTTLPAPISTFSPIVIPPRIVALAPIETPSESVVSLDAMVYVKTMEFDPDPLE